VYDNCNAVAVVEAVKRLDPSAAHFIT